MKPEDASGNKNLMFVLNPSTFAKEQEVSIGDNVESVPYGIAYDAINNQYYVAMDGTIKILDSSFNIVDSFNLTYNINMGTPQNIECYDEKIFVVHDNKICVYASGVDECHT